MFHLETLEIVNVSDLNIFPSALRIYDTVFHLETLTRKSAAKKGEISI